ncbi:DUF1553 domain-containing protein [Thalassoglobus polymorphus]|uniref:Planctomycete cytochrome C n=1 Tax=Thalassoglobus polymorphus TaxID=2527994 RepID=A0A517QKU3_9PLAN|nr:DUF1553 domain-containing protein [Thalassoglobus polymorphus]QDT32238.1 hypothetical protein Mal48_14810 [Thalassoglobus polymorphus]
MSISDLIQGQELRAPRIQIRGVFTSIACSVCLVGGILSGTSTSASEAGDLYGEKILEDAPLAWWRMQIVEGKVVQSDGLKGLFPAEVVGSVKSISGPESSRFTEFAKESQAVRFNGRAASLRVNAAADQSALQFSNGDEMTLEAWVRVNAIQSTVYIIGKGRTHTNGFGDRNQNYSLRLVQKGGRAHLSFFFCDAVADAATRAQRKDGHRWTSNSGFPIDGDWHHVAITYRFGEPDSMTGYIDGFPGSGKWDLGGPTSHPPVTDNDQLWIGSSMGGKSGVFNGDIAEVAIYKSIVPADHLRERYIINGEKLTGRVIGEVDPEKIPSDSVQVFLTEGIPASRNWGFVLTTPPSKSWTADRIAFTGLPRKYTDKALIDDYSLPLLLTAATQINVSSEQAGEHRIVLRALSAAKLFVDGKLVGETPFQSLSRSGHGAMHQLKPPQPGLLSLPAAHTEQHITLPLSPGRHIVVLESIIGHPGVRLRVGELSVGISGPDETAFRILSPTKSIPFNDEEWITFIEQERNQLVEMNQKERRHKDQKEREWWERRHVLTRQIVESLPTVDVPNVSSQVNVSNEDVSNEIDRFIQKRLEENGIKPAPVATDLQFLRRLSLDVVGVIPTPEEVDRYMADPAEERRENSIERLLNDPRWADHWVPYWQDVLAENVGIAKPTLNNTGPFRFFIHSAFTDNKPIDRFVTELTLMEGSRYSGGPAGFGIATQNDVPMAAKAHVLGTAFLGVEMKCARCHDSPLQSVSQKDLFSLAAMLGRTGQTVPLTSSIPGTPEEVSEMLVQVTLRPGTKVLPEWPFTQMNNSAISEIPDDAIRNPDDQREQLALLITWPTNERFAQVIANRLWKRYLGRGLQEPVHDWENFAPSHPELLDYLAHQLVLNDYDVKHLARLILNSQTYQRQVSPLNSEETSKPELFAGNIERRLTAEQVVDSLQMALGKDLDTEELTLDRDGRQLVKEFVSLGYPQRAWEMAGTSNDRDRPSTVWPKAQSLVDLMMAFGWRQSRPDPVTVRETTTTPLTPLMLAHGATALRVVDLSDSSEVTQLALEDQPLEHLVERLFMRILTRPPTATEKQLVFDLLQEGYSERVVAGLEVVPAPQIPRSPRSWSNNLNSESNEVAIRAQAQALKGDPKTKRLAPDWRVRLEETIWSLVNLPEFAFVP